MAVSPLFSLDGIVQVNPSGWGPCLDIEPKDIMDIPYAPFTKSDRLGRVVEWNKGSASTNNNQMKWMYQQRARDKDFNSNITTMFNAFEVFEDEQEEFEMVDNRPVSKPKFPGKKKWQGNRGRGGRGGRYGGGGGGGMAGGSERALTKEQKKNANPQRTRWSKYNSNRKGARAWWSNVMTSRSPSCDVKAHWEILEEFELSVLLKLTMKHEPAAETLLDVGAIPLYNRSYDRLTTRTEKKLLGEEANIFNPTPSDDPILQRFSEEGTGNVFITDTILSFLMTAPRSVHSWNVAIEKKDGKIFFNKTEPSVLDLLTVNETSNDPPSEENGGPEGINLPGALATEATALNIQFCEQVTDASQAVELGDSESPFGEAANVGYRYRSFRIDDATSVVVRCSIGAYVPAVEAAASSPAGKAEATEGEVSLVNIYTFNEYDSRLSGMGWRKCLDSQRGAIFANEIKNNSAKVARWTLQSLLGEVDFIKVGYISRHSESQNDRHVILGCQTYRPSEIARQINLPMTQAWAIVKRLIESVRALPDGEYMLLKDPNRAVARLYSTRSREFSSVSAASS